MRLKLVMVALVSALTVVVASACGGGGAGTNTQTARVAMSDLLRFEPAEIRVKAGQEVVLTVDNTKNSAMHDFVIDQLPTMAAPQLSGDTMAMGDGGSAIDISMNAGKKGEVRFMPMQPGEYRYYCSLPGHADGGMTGRLIVE